MPYHRSLIITWDKRCSFFVEISSGSMIQCGWAQDTPSDGNPGCVSLPVSWVLVVLRGFTCPSIQEKTRETSFFSNFLFLFFPVIFFEEKTSEKPSDLADAWSGWADLSRKPVTWIEVLPQAPFPKQIKKNGHGPTKKVGVSNHLINPRYPKIS